MYIHFCQSLKDEQDAPNMSREHSSTKAKALTQKAQIINSSNRHSCPIIFHYPLGTRGQKLNILTMTMEIYHVGQRLKRIRYIKFVKKSIKAICKNLRW
jgi:hypothetical protein